jgi:hypothetical protein
MPGIALRKMKHELQGGSLGYNLCGIDITGRIGSNVSFTFAGKIECIGCGRSTKKSFSQGFCFPCMRDKACCDTCIVRPELCHYQKGTCREPEWGEKHCLIEHVVYLASTSNVKVGVTGAHKVLERWGDQGALQAMVIGRFPERKLAGECEHALKKVVGDKTDWRGLLCGKDAEFDLNKVYAELQTQVPEEFQEYLLSPTEAERGLQKFTYPVNSYLTSAKTWDLDKTPTVSGELTGIRGQYLLIGDKGLNVRKFQGYLVEFV